MFATLAGVAELADATDSKSVSRKGVWVRPPPPVGCSENPQDANGFYFKSVLKMSSPELGVVSCFLSFPKLTANTEIEIGFP